MTRLSQFSLSSVLATLVCTLLVACGSGGDAGSSPTGAAPAASGGSLSSAAANLTPVSSSGTISAFGSVYINGNHFNVTGAQITLDDDPVSEQELQVGQTATVVGTAAVGAGMASLNAPTVGIANATALAVRSQVIGAVTSVAAASSTFVVLGQTVKVNSQTTFDPVIAPGDITGIHVGDLVAVFGPTAADGSITARLVARGSAAQGLRVTGTVAGVNTAAHTFRINALTVDYTSATLLGFASGAPANGDIVQARGTTYTAATTTLAAAQLARLPQRPASTGSAIVEVEGLVTRFASLTDFDVAGQKVTTTPGTQYRNGTSAQIALNSNVEVHGAVNASGVLVAANIDVHNNGVYGLTAPITALNAGTATLTVLGTSVSVDSLTRLLDASPARVRNFSFSDLRVGDTVALLGYETSAGSGRLTATMLTRVPATTTVVVKGPYTATTAPQFKVLGVTVNAAAAAFYSDPGTAMTSASFFGQAAGRQVAVTGTGTGPVAASRVLLLPADFD